ncbi:MAG TPA: hypothetical protein VJ999_01860 [Candidatus Sulfotelmatobacter sp.]|nr:hypothetical protein [Candidatus Sulfotelmatobacter sp.]
MQAVCKALALASALTVLFSIASTAQQAGRIESMKLLTPDVGWAATNSQLFWTTDGGGKWKDITPKSSHKRQWVSSVFFLNSSAGWALLHCRDGRDPVADDGCFELASTTDAGESWSMVRQKVASPFSREQLENSPGFSGRSWLEFVDSQHGWEILKIATGSGPPSAGEMLRTVDGGKNWVATKDLPMPDHFHFLTSKNGWIAGGDEGGLFVTHDAGDSWQKVSLPDPAGLGQHLGGYYGLPMFEGEQRGFEWVEYTTGPSEGPNEEVLVLFVSEDGGKNWRLEKKLSALPTLNYVDVVDGTAVAAHSELDQVPQGEGQCPVRRIALSLFRISQDGASSFSSASIPIPDGVVQELTFISRDRGWAKILGRLFVTQDGGGNWVEITPGGAPPEVPSVCAPVKTVPARKSPTGAVPAQQPASASSVSMHLGFDITRVPCPTSKPCTTAQSLPVMQAWMSSSPFYDHECISPPPRPTGEPMQR